MKINVEKSILLNCTWDELIWKILKMMQFTQLQRTNFLKTIEYKKHKA